MHENISCLQHQSPFQETLMEKTFLNFHQGLTKWTLMPTILHQGLTQWTLMYREPTQRFTFG
jgi:hypothetical protein